MIISRSPRARTVWLSTSALIGSSPALLGARVFARAAQQEKREIASNLHDVRRRGAPKPCRTRARLVQRTAAEDAHAGRRQRGRTPIGRRHRRRLWLVGKRWRLGQGLQRRGDAPPDQVG